MVKVVSLLLLTIALSANTLDVKISEYLDEDTYQTHKNLIKILFKNQDRYYHDNKYDVLSILKTLKKNGLLKQKFEQPIDFKLEVSSYGNSKLFIKTILDSLTSMGYNFVTLDTVIKINNQIKVILLFSTEYILDPNDFGAELKKRKAFIKDIQRVNSRYWKYKIDSNKLILSHLKSIGKDNTSVELTKTLDDYYIRLEDDNKELSIKSHIGNRWYPDVSFYDKNLVLLKNIKRDKTSSHLLFQIPMHSKYMRISDLYTLNNLKRGLTIYIKKEIDEY